MSDLNDVVGQLSALRDRVGQLTDQPRDAVDDDVRLQLQEIGERLRANEELHAQVGETCSQFHAEWQASRHGKAPGQVSVAAEGPH